MYNLSIQANTELRFILINIILNIFIMKLWWGFSDRRMKPKDIWHICISSLSSLLFPLFCHCIAVYTLARVFGVEGELSGIARQGSGSACRSMYGGFVQWIMGHQDNGKDSLAQQVEPETHWPELRILVLVVGLCMFPCMWLSDWEWQNENESMMWVNTVLAHLRLLVKVTYFYKWPFLV